VVGVINFAGGRGHNPAEPGTVCQPDRLVDTLRAFGASGKLPSLWVYAENDRVFNPDLARRMHQAYVTAGGKATLAMTPPVGQDGHRVFVDGAAAWRGPVDGFLAQLGLPTLRPAPDSPMPAGLGPSGQAGFRAFAQSPLPFKAFASSGDGLTGWAASPRARDEARGGAMRFCQRDGKSCQIVAEVVEIEDR
jgi:hypothetical protein